MINYAQKITFNFTNIINHINFAYNKYYRLDACQNSRFKRKALNIN